MSSVPEKRKSEYSLPPSPSPVARYPRRGSKGTVHTVSSEPKAPPGKRGRGRPPGSKSTASGVKPAPQHHRTSEPLVKPWTDDGNEEGKDLEILMALARLPELDPRHEKVAVDAAQEFLTTVRWNLQDQTLRRSSSKLFSSVLKAPELDDMALARPIGKKPVLAAEPEKTEAIQKMESVQVGHGKRTEKDGCLGLDTEGKKTVGKPGLESVA
ncbi:MAG: hypothetical protein Q9216_005863 [Gyalolechia sp. 2 TL-2023]